MDSRLVVWEDRKKCRGDPCGLPKVVRELEIIKTKAGGDKPLPYERKS